MRKTLLIAIAVSGLAGTARHAVAEPVLGYTDTPMLPSGKWHVHDPARTRPPVVTPGATFSDGAAPPADAIVLFDGNDLSHWESDKGGEAKWTVRQDYMEVKPHSEGIHTKEKFGDFQLHLEFAEPVKVVGDSQERGNSGVFLQGIYEVQVLDCFDNPTYPDGQCGAVYGQSPPLVNACKKPGQWQAYDIIFEAARWNENHELVRPASVTVIQNGLLLHNKQAILGPTGHKTLAKYKKQLPDEGSLALQDHGNPVRFRNIWIRRIHEEEQP
ncbi:MAG TPA: DUF1080 domain-containing protein [Verrucomicrobiae bacterium]|jgi:hypothetical protein